MAAFHSRGIGFLFSLTCGSMVLPMSEGKASKRLDLEADG